MTQVQDPQEAGSRCDWEQKESCNIKLKSERQEAQNSKNKLLQHESKEQTGNGVSDRKR